MKILKKIIDKRRKIFAIRVNLDPQTDDMWNIYNLLDVGDCITGTCTRRIQKETATSTMNEKKRITLTLKVKSFIFDGENDSLRIQGTNARENRFIGMGVAQAMDINPPR
jgi:stalled ribosome rescue protein Dom34